MLNLNLSFISFVQFLIVFVYLEFFFFFLGNWANSRKKYSSR